MTDQPPPPQTPTLPINPSIHSLKGFFIFFASSWMFEIERFLDEGSWELAGCQISTIICLLGLKQIRLGVLEVPGPLLTGTVEVSERVTFSL